ncbi:MAG: hypothetical protein LLF76_05725 [Planctomycetaceae bacterium]|nr:hypothetical protein [Planctomycetaceae bacterium]
MSRIFGTHIDAGGLQKDKRPQSEQTERVIAMMNLLKRIVGVLSVPVQILETPGGPDRAMIADNAVEGGWEDEYPPYWQSEQEEYPPDDDPYGLDDDKFDLDEDDTAGWFEEDL